MDGVYRTIQGDTWDAIAKKVYGNERKMDFLMEKNPDLLDHFVFSAGILVRVPEILADTEDDLPEWRK